MALEHANDRETSSFDSSGAQAKPLDSDKNDSFHQKGSLVCLTLSYS